LLFFGKTRISAVNVKVKNILPSAVANQTRHWFEIKNASEKSVEISIMDEIGGWGISARHLVDRIKSVGDKTLIKLHIFSPGGDVLAGNEIYNALKEHKGGVEVTIGALCASIATVIAMAGRKITMAKNGLFMIHNPWVFAIGESEDLRRMADVMDKMKTNIVDTYQSRTKMPVEEVAQLMDDESWFTAEEAKEKGFVDSVKDADGDEEDVKDRFDLSRFKNAISALSRIHRKTPAPAGADGNPPVAQPSGDPPKPKSKPSKPSQPSLIHMYQSGKIRVFNSILMGSIAMMMFAPNVGQGEGGTATEEPPVDEAKVKALAKGLYEAKLKRDQEIDDIVLSVRTRDKKDFSELAAEYKKQDKTADEFARALTTSDKFKPHEVIGSGIEITDAHRGLPRGTPGELFVASEEYKAIRDMIKRGAHKHVSALVEMKDVLVSALDLAVRNAATTSTGLTSIEKLPGVVTLGVRPLMVKDLIAPGTTANTSIRYIQENAYPGGGAGMVAQGAAKPEVTFTLAEVTADVKKIAAYTKVTDELFADFLAVASYINMRLPYMVERVEEDQLLNGDGTGNNLLGIMNFAGVQSQARGADTNADAIYKAFTLVRWGNLAGAAQGGFEPDAIVIHPTNWQTIRLAKDANGQYFGGGPFTGAYGNGPLVQFDSLWGKPVVITPAIAVNTALVGAFRLASQYFQRQGLTVESTNTDQDDFIKNLTTIRAEERLALAVYRPPAFCQVTGLN
jgi:HK97 family phage major capsid protein